jgi:hypothetical protein
MIAIDAGVSGGIAVLLPGEAATAFNMPPTDAELLQKLKMAQRTNANTAYLEDVVYFTGTKIPGSRGIKYGVSFGKVYGMLLGLGFQVKLVPPKKWQTTLGLGPKAGMSRTAWKAKLADKARELFPDLKVTLATADALCILAAAKAGRIE